MKLQRKSKKNIQRSEKGQQNVPTLWKYICPLIFLVRSQIRFPVEEGVGGENSISLQFRALSNNNNNI